MKIQSLTGGAVAMTTLLISATASWAELTPRQVWNDWRGYMSGFGYEIEAEAATQRGVLTVSDIKMQLPMPEDEGQATIMFPEITFKETDDGAVAISIPSPMPIVIEGSGKEGSGSVTVDYITEGYSMVASGDPDNMTYTYSADSMAIVLGEIISDGTPEEVGEAKIELSDVSGQTETNVTELRRTVQSLTSGPITYMFDFVDSEEGDRMQMNGWSESLTLKAETTVPMSVDMNKFDEALEAGFAIDGTYTFGPGNSNMDFKSQTEGEAFQFKSTSSGGNLSLDVNKDKTGLGMSYSDITMDMVSNDLPFPIAFASEKLGLSFAMPIAKSEDPQDFQLGVLLRDFTMSEFLWSIFDAEGVLPRDPATIALDLSGEATLNADLMDPAAMETENVPGEVNRVSINDLRLSLAGAELTGEGALELDNTDLTTYDGMPKPVGKINLALTGGNTLIDRLVELGLVPEEQAMVARMTMGMFMVPTGEDSLKSELEFTEEGNLFANGQRLK